MKVYCYCNGISEGILELRLCMYVQTYVHSIEKAPEGAQSRRPETYASTGSSSRCEQICLPRLPENYVLAQAIAVHQGAAAATHSVATV